MCADGRTARLTEKKGKAYGRDRGELELGPWNLEWTIGARDQETWEHCCIAERRGRPKSSPGAVPASFCLRQKHELVFRPW